MALCSSCQWNEYLAAYISRHLLHNSSSCILFDPALQDLQEKNMALSSVEARCVAADRRASGALR
jgi:hypothetical protein